MDLAGAVPAAYTRKTHEIFTQTAFQDLKSAMGLCIMYLFC